jgi:hypothetical protein
MRIRHDRDQRRFPKGRAQNLKKGGRTVQGVRREEKQPAGEPGRFERKSMCFKSMYFEVPA